VPPNLAKTERRSVEKRVSRTHCHRRFLRGATENKKVALGFVEALSSGKIEVAKAALADDAPWWIPGSLPVSGTHRGKKAIAEDFLGQAQTFFQPNSVSIQVRNAIAEGDYIAVEWGAAWPCGTSIHS
jgi:ketosteroid isomerase-like protein